MIDTSEYENNTPDPSRRSHHLCDSVASEENRCSFIRFVEADLSSNYQAEIFLVFALYENSILEVSLIGVN